VIFARNPRFLPAHRRLWACDMAWFAYPGNRRHFQTGWFVKEQKAASSPVVPLAREQAVPR
jgi:hypothetical protein